MKIYRRRSQPANTRYAGVVWSQIRHIPIFVDDESVCEGVPAIDWDEK